MGRSNPDGRGEGWLSSGGALTGGEGADDHGLLPVPSPEFGARIASVHGLARALTRTTGLSGDERAEALRLATDHAAHLTAMLDAVRVVAEHLPGSLAGTERRTSTSLEDLVWDAAHAANLQRLTVYIAPVVGVVTIDVSGVRRILTDLLEKACTYGAEPIRLDADYHAGGLRILIIASGPGMSADRAVRAFDHDVPAADTSYGLRLWIVTQLVTMLGGTMAARTNDPTGTRVEVRLPLTDQGGAGQAHGAN
jgi:signal transduction histidine kinase